MAEFLDVKSMSEIQKWNENLKRIPFCEFRLTCDFGLLMGERTPETSALWSFHPVELDWLEWAS